MVEIWVNPYGLSMILFEDLPTVIISRVQKEKGRGNEGSISRPQSGVPDRMNTTC